MHCSRRRKSRWTTRASTHGGGAARPLVIAHRGQSAQGPENTLDSFARAIDLGAEVIEGDVQMSRDGRLAMMHGTLENRQTEAGYAGDLTWDQLQRLDAGASFGPEFAGLRIPAWKPSWTLPATGMYRSAST